MFKMMLEHTAIYVQILAKYAILNIVFYKNSYIID